MTSKTPSACISPTIVLPYSNDKRYSEDIKKYDRKTAQYTKFEGLTVISPLKTDATEFYKLLKKIVESADSSPKSLPLLPLASFHMTIAGLFCRNKFPTCEAYNANLEAWKSKFIALKEYFAKTGGSGSKTIRMKLKKFYFTMGIGIDLEPVDPLETRELEKAVQTILNQKETRHQHFHLSIAYQVNHQKLTAAQIQQLNEAVEKCFSRGILEFSWPQLCYFNDMTEFIPL